MGNLHSDLGDLVQVSGAETEEGVARRAVFPDDGVELQSRWSDPSTSPIAARRPNLTILAEKEVLSRVLHVPLDPELRILRISKYKTVVEPRRLGGHPVQELIVSLAAPSINEIAAVSPPMMGEPFGRHPNHQNAGSGGISQSFIEALAERMEHAHRSGRPDIMKHRTKEIPHGALTADLR
jgi:hypothetical protein